MKPRQRGRKDSPVHWLAAILRKELERSTRKVHGARVDCWRRTVPHQLSARSAAALRSLLTARILHDGLVLWVEELKLHWRFRRRHDGARHGVRRHLGVRAPRRDVPVRNVEVERERGQDG